MAELLALLPILILLVCMIGLGWTAARSGMISAAAGLAVAAWAFQPAPGLMSVAGPLAEAAFTAATILWIIFPALALHEFQMRSGASDRIGSWLVSISDKREVLALLLAWFFALLLEGAAGFGTPVALVAPMLVTLGFSPERSLLLALIGHAAGVSFGAVGTPMLPLLQVLAVDPKLLSGTIMLMHAALGWMLALVVFRLAAPVSGGATWFAVPTAAALFLLPALALAWLSGPELPTLGGALIGLLLFIAVAKWRWSTGSRSASAANHGVLSAILPYGLVLVAILATRTVPSLAAWLQSFAWEWSLGDRFAGSVKPLYHPGTMLMLALAVAAVASRRNRAVILPSLSSAALRLPSVALALVSVLMLARIMVHSGMIDTLATAAAGLLGSAWPAAVPMVGALGSFVTGSATASNVLFAGFQVAAAEAVGFAPMLALAGQSFGAAIGNVIAPHNIVAGAATVGLIGREGAVLKRTLPVCLVYALLGGGLLSAFASLR
ncbi:L-lactate permease [Rhodopseudomonas sp. NSM]|uniref:L-lactate permease n=1 Tax=Rhodopseudomonas sp. NSM TaxID=3457630 RepID=UPI004035F450